MKVTRVTVPPSAGLPLRFGDLMPWGDSNFEEVLAEWLGVPPQQLNFGEEIQRKVDARRARWDSGIGYQDRDVFEAFLKLPIPQRKLVREVILTFAKVHGAGTPGANDSKGVPGPVN